MATTATSAEATILPAAGAVRPLAIAAAATVAVGLIARRRDLVRGGIRLGAVQLTAATIDAVVRRLEKPDAPVAAPPPMVVEAMAMWLAETLVGAALDRIDPAPGRVVVTAEARSKATPRRRP